MAHRAERTDRPHSGAAVRVVRLAETVTTTSLRPETGSLRRFFPALVSNGELHHFIGPWQHYARGATGTSAGHGAPPFGVVCRCLTRGAALARARVSHLKGIAVVCVRVEGSQIGEGQGGDEVAEAGRGVLG
ncbi:hypothetical protein BJV78DRAFT_1154300 [Lactifluus subvellereus]|nr:hypothetical protein BJV78DRAFT_1154300 [Lactifluus subvellereus]